MKKREKNRLFTAGCALALTISAGTLSIQAADSAVDEEKARQIALADAGVKEEDVQRLSARYEHEDREEVISVEFICDRIEYEYTIRESDGMILEWSIEGMDVGSTVMELSLSGEASPAGDSQSGTADDQSDVSAAADDGSTADPDAAKAGQNTLIAIDGGSIIGIEAAKDIVLQDAGVSPEDVMFTKIKFEYQGRYYDYEIEMSEGRSEFEYTLDAETGDIIESENDWDD